MPVTAASPAGSLFATRARPAYPAMGLSSWMRRARPVERHFLRYSAAAIETPVTPAAAIEQRHHEHHPYRLCYFAAQFAQLRAIVGSVLVMHSARGFR